MVIWNLFLIISISKQICFQRQPKKFQIHRNLVYISSIMFYSFITAQIFHLLLFTFGNNKSSTLFIIVLSLYYIIYSIGFVSFYIIMVFRLFYVFKDSMYEMTKISIYFHIAILILVAISFVTAITVYELRLYFIFYIFLSIAIFLFAIGFGHLVYSFNYRLFLHILSRRTSHLQHQQQRPALQYTTSIVDTFSVHQMKLYGTIVRHTLLGTITIGMIALFVVVNSLLIFIHLVDSDTAEIMFWWSQCFCLNVITLCIYFGFNFNSERYEKCCKQCDNGCSAICECLANAKMGKELDLVSPNSPMSPPTETISEVPDTEMSCTNDLVGMMQNEIEQNVKKVTEFSDGGVVFYENSLDPNNGDCFRQTSNVTDLNSVDLATLSADVRYLE